MLKYNFLYPIRKELKNKTNDWMTSDSIFKYEENIKKNKDLIFEYFNYKFNNYGFRCDDFTNYNQHKYRILFLGCSHTEGIGLPLEEIWAYKLLKAINEELNENIPYWTIAQAGTGIDQQVRTLYQLNDMLRPNIIIALFPDAIRREIHNELCMLYNAEMRIDSHLIENTKIDKKTREDYYKIFSDDKLILYQTGKNLAFLKTITEKYDTKVIANSVRTIYFDEYYDCFDFYRYKTDFFSCKIDFARDILHHGKKSNTMFALKVYDEIFPIVKQILQ